MFRTQSCHLLVGCTYYSVCKKFVLIWSTHQLFICQIISIKPVTMNAEDVRLVQEEEKQAKEWKFPFNISDNPEFELVVNLVDYLGDRKYTCCGEVEGIARHSDYPKPCLLRFPTIYTGMQSWDDLHADLNKVDEKQCFQFTVRNTKHTAQATAWTLSCTRHRMAEPKVCKRVFDYPDAQFASGMKVTSVKENRRAEQRGPTGIHQPRKTEITTHKERRHLSIKNQHPFQQEG
jgi:hypothetical protein